MIDDISIKLATKTNHKINIMKRFLIVVMLIMGLQLCYDNMAKADDLDPTSELITGFLKRKLILNYQTILINHRVHSSISLMMEMKLWFIAQ